MASFTEFHYDIDISAAGTVYTDAFKTGADGHDEVEATLNVTTITGSGTTFDVTPQYSYDKITWFDQPASMCFTQATTAGGATAESKDHSFTGMYFRYKIVTGGASPVVAGTIDAVSK